MHRPSQTLASLGLAAGAALAIVTPAISGVYSYVIDDTQSELVLTVGGFEFSGAAQGTFLLATEGFADGDLAVVLDLDASIDDINVGLGTLEDMTIQSVSNEDALGQFEPDAGDLVKLLQSLPLNVHGVWDPLFGTNEIVDENVTLCLGGVSFCGEESGEATVHTVTLSFDAIGNTVLPAEENPLGEDIPVRLVLVANGTPGGPADTPFEPVSLAGGIDVWPNPSRGMVHFSLPRVPSTEIDVLVSDISGRQVASWSSAPTDQVSWDGRSSLGDRVAPGVYLVTIEGAGQRHRAKLLRVR